MKLIPKTSSLAFRLTVWYIVILGLITALAGAFLYQGYRKGLMSEFDGHLSEIAEDAVEFKQRRSVTWEEAMSRAEARHPNESPVLLAVVLGGKAENADKPEVHRTDQVQENVLIFSGDVYRRADKRDWDRPLYVTVPGNGLARTSLRVAFFPVRGNTIIQVAVPLDRINGELRRLALIMALAGLILLSLASLGGVFIIRKALR
ncbi:MAG: hypothetical protein JW843_07855, partial [Candidatus Aminicenantes bacterium]|nr:hypothetical protein [Candidatus Aminicenantes bacterium]